MSTKTAIVTGGAGGLGRAIARGLRENGWDFALVDVAETVYETAVDLGGQGLRYDITDRASRAARRHMQRDRAWPGRGRHGPRAST